MWYIGRKNNRNYYRYSISEKINYYSNMLKSNNPKKVIKAQKNLDRLNAILHTNNSLGKVFVVKDNIFNSSANRNKPRQVVCTGFKNNEMVVVPIRKNKNMISLKNFDNQRSINLNQTTTISLDKVYEKRSFKNTSNSYLTSDELDELRRKIIK